MNKIAVTFCSLIFSFVCFSQAPALHTQLSIGGSASDNMEGPNSISGKVQLKTKHGNTIVAGTSFSNNGNIPGNKGGADIFVGELDNADNWLWKRTYGGSGNDYMMSIQPAIERGYVILATTNSANGDVSTNHGNDDIWVLRIDDDGDPVWNKSFGGCLADAGGYLTKLGDSGYIFIGTVHSNDGDVAGIHIDPADTSTTPKADIWITRIDSSGNRLWSKTYGGTFFWDDIGTIIKPSPYGGFICGAVTGSGNYESTGNHGVTDIWVAKLDSKGDIEWSRSCGGTGREYLGDLEVYNDGYVIAGSTFSNDGDVSGNHGGSSHASSDIWIAKLSLNGQMVWQKCIGGTGNESFEDVERTADGGFVAVGYSNSSNGDISGNKGGYDALIVKIDRNGSLEWQKCFGGTGNEYALNVITTLQNEFLVLAETSSVDGDVISNHGQDDLWLIKFGSASIIKGSVFFDDNSNGIKDPSEQFASGFLVTAAKPNYSQSAITQKGLFEIKVDTGTYTTSLKASAYHSITPGSSSSTFSSYFQTDSLSFALQPIPGKQDLVVSVIPLTVLRAGLNSSYRLFYKNAGTTTIPSGELVFIKDAKVNFISALPAINNFNGDTLKWNYNSLKPGDSASIEITTLADFPPAVKIGDSLFFKAIIYPDLSDETPLDNMVMLKQRVVGSYDPNDKTENNGGIIGSDYITAGKYLNYTIRFQNTGTDTAFNVIVRDTLDSKLDWSTFEMVAASHPYSVSITNQNKLEWTFADINLSDSNINEPLSHGYLSYRVKPKSTAAVGDVINNLASIYFDYNLPVATNNAITLVQDNFSALPLQLINFTGQLTNNTVQLNWHTANETNFEKFEIERSVDGASFNRIGSVAFVNTSHDYKATDNVAQLSTRHIFYRLKLIDSDGKFSYSKVIAFNINAATRFTVYPNPANTEMFVSITADKKSNLQLKIIDASGRTVSEEQKTIEKGNNVFPVNTSKLKKGNYLLQIVAGEEIKTSKFIIMN